ncbi:carbohydrate esterase family 9 protein [Cyathus striatus]|nr:carbohydrate esterase family 9 protein [Cyathus striatus]
MSEKTHILELNAIGRRSRGSIPTVLLIITGLAALSLLGTIVSFHTFTFTDAIAHRVPANAQTILSHCVSLKATPGPAQDFFDRKISDRFEPGTNATLLRNCTIFTGEHNGTVVTHGDILVDKGIIKRIGKVTQREIDNTPNLTVVEANGAWVTPGLVDLHSHLGVLSAPVLSGAFDLNSPKGPILPWLRSVDGLNTHDEAYALAIAGGVTTAQILPGSGNAIGGQAFMVKLRKTKERSPSSMVVEPPHSLNGTISSAEYTPFRWRHMKQACGENLRSYGTRMDSMWSFRSAYNEARKVKNAQDEYCAKAEAGMWNLITQPFPESFQWEMLVDVLRGRVKISNHCYEAVDLDDIVRLTNEFQFPLATFHHASEAYLVPDLLKRTWGGTPTIAIFATNHRYKREAYRGSEFAGRILADEGIPVVMKSDHPVINSRYLIHEAQQAHYFSLPASLALASVTSVPAAAAGLSHRIGVLREGADADIVLWDSHPLRIGATPIKVWIDGIVQIPIPSKTDTPNNVVVGKGKDGEEWKEIPKTPNWDKERNETLKWDGLPPLQGRRKQDAVAFINVQKVWLRSDGGEITEAASFTNDDFGTVIIENGKITCMESTCITRGSSGNVIDLKGGSISPGLMTYGSPIGLEEIRGEPSTGDGELLDAFQRNIPKILDDTGGVVRAADGLMFGTRNALIAYRSGVTFATSSLAKPIFLYASEGHLIAGLSVTFRTGASHAMESGAIIQDVVALHVVIGRAHPVFHDKSISVSTQVAALRRLLFGWESTDKETGLWFRRASEGVVPLVIEVDSADIMATLLILKTEIENNIGSRMKMVFSGAAEAHLLAKEIGEADVGVILNPVRPFPTVWDQRRILPGPPLTNDTALVTLMQHGVVVGLGIHEAWQASNVRFELEWAKLESNGRVNERQAYAMATSDLERLLGVRAVEDVDLVAFEGGGLFDLSSKVAAIISAQRGFVEVF